MHLSSKIAYAIAIAGAVTLTASGADARHRHSRAPTYEYDRGTYDYVGAPASTTGTFSYGASRAPYGGNLDYPRDFQLQGHN